MDDFFNEYFDCKAEDFCITNHVDYQFSIINNTPNITKESDLILKLYNSSTVIVNNAGLFKLLICYDFIDIYNNDLKSLYYISVHRNYELIKHLDLGHCPFIPCSILWNIKSETSLIIKSLCIKNLWMMKEACKEICKIYDVNDDINNYIYYNICIIIKFILFG
jgi:hypothetical protein